MNVIHPRSNTAPLTAEMIAAWGGLFAGENAVVTAEKGLFLRHPLLDVIVSVWPSEENEGHFDVLVSAFQPGGKRVRLDKMALRARGKDGVGAILRFGRVTARGDLALDGLRAGITFRLHSPDMIVKDQERSRAAWAAQGAEGEPASQQPQPVESTDGSVRGMMRRLSDRTVEVVFETNDARWADAVVRFALVQATGRVEYEGEARLNYVRDGLWESPVQKGIRVAAAADLVFEVQART
jgi:hypothetical protein